MSENDITLPSKVEVIEEVEEKTSIEYSKLDFAKNSVSVKMGSSTGSKKIKVADVLKYMEDPVKNATDLQGISSYLKTTNGIYSRLINHFGNIPTFDYMLYPSILKTKKGVNSEKLKTQYIDTATFLDRFNVDFNLRWMCKELFEIGELYIYKIEDSQGVVLKKMPNECCRITSMENNISLYSIDLQKLSGKNYEGTLPDEIQSLVEKFAQGSMNKDELVDGRWLELEKNAVAFNIISPTLYKGYPPFSYLFDALIHVDEIKQLHYTSAKLENLKIIHQKIPINEEGEFLIDIGLIKEYHKQTKQHLPDGIAVTTNPLQMESIVLNKSNSQGINYRHDLIESIFDDAGVNDELFNGKKSSNEAIALGAKADDMLLLSVLCMFENYLNYEVSMNKKSSPWRVKMLSSTQFNKDNMLKNSRENLAFGGSRLEFLSLNHYTPLQAMNVLEAESMLGIDQLLVPQMTSHTMGNQGTSSSEKGVDSKKDSTKTNPEVVSETPQMEN
ncbi:MAG: hypothetical protein ACRDA3_13085 [Peptostreptococcaceae bacterium]